MSQLLERSPGQTPEPIILSPVDAAISSLRTNIAKGEAFHAQGIAAGIGNLATEHLDLEAFDAHLGTIEVGEPPKPGEKPKREFYEVLGIKIEGVHQVERTSDKPEKYTDPETGITLDVHRLEIDVSRDWFIDPQGRVKTYAVEVNPPHLLKLDTEQDYDDGEIIVDQERLIKTVRVKMEETRARKETAGTATSEPTPVFEDPEEPFTAAGLKEVPQAIGKHIDPPSGNEI